MPDHLTRSVDPDATAPPAAGGLTPPVQGAPVVPGYELLDEVGSGGMGVVYRARDLGLNREVAVKLLLPKYAPGSAAAARFVDEARVTAQLQHPGIPAVYQVGALAGGRPFLAMKLIKGRTLAGLLAGAGREPPGGDARPVGSADQPGGPRPPLARTLPPTLDPLAVFEAVCQAVGYAHAHGVLHRDLKPANVMVGAFGEVQVMDWGLAKVLAGGGRQPPESPGDPEATAAQTEIRTQRDSDGSFTQAGSVLGTPAYMPPEQAAGEQDKVGPRADVFGLGALLCALLTGRPPYAGGDPEAVRLSAVRGRTEAAFARLDGSGADPDVVALCKRCLAFEPADRPASADEVAAAVAGLRRAADDRARAAERDKLAAEVRAAEQAKRRRSQQWAGTAVAAVLAAGITASLWQARAARREADAAEAARQAEADRAEGERAAKVEARAAEGRAETARDEARAREKDANDTARFFEDKVFSAARPKDQGGGLGYDVTLRQAVTAALPALADGFKGQPLVEARLRLTLGTTFGWLGDPNAAVEQDERARALFTAHRGPDHPDTLMSMANLAGSYSKAGRPADALRLGKEVLAAQKRVLGADHPNTLQSMTNLAGSYSAVGQHASALELNEDVVAAQKRVLGADHPDTLMSINNLGVWYYRLGRHEDARKRFEDALAAYKRVLGADHPDTLRSMGNLAGIYRVLGRYDRARELNEKVIAGRKAVLGPTHIDTLRAMNDLIVCHLALGRHADALRVVDDILALGRHADAVRVIDDFLAHAREVRSHPDWVGPVADGRLRHFEAAADPAGCRTTAEAWEGFGFGRPADLYNAAGMRAVAARLYAEKGQPVEAAADADRAVAWLKQAVAAGFRDRGHIERDADLAALRGRADFRALVGGLPYTAPPPRPKR